MFGLGKNKKKEKLKIKNKKDNTLWDEMKNIKPTMKTQTAYKSYRLQGGEKSYEQWLKGER